MTIRYVKYETGDYTYDTQTGKWTKLGMNNSSLTSEDMNMNNYYNREKILLDKTLELHSKIVKPMPGNYIPELSSNHEIWDLGRRLRSREEDENRLS